jgi:uncharacterized protein YPO0396
MQGDYVMTAKSTHGGPEKAIWVLFTMAFLLSLPCAHPVRAEDRLKQFQEAVKYMEEDKGCLSIPFSDYQDQCQRKQNEVNKLCKKSGPSNCDDVDPKKIQKKIEEVKTKRDELKREKEDLERQKSSLTGDEEKRANEEKIKEVDRKLYELERTREDLEKQVSDATKDVNDRLYLAKACRDARVAVQGVFRDARSSAKSESDTEIAPLARRLVEYWEKGESEHEKSIDDAKKAVETCDKVLYEIGHLGNF